MNFNLPHLLDSLRVRIVAAVALCGFTLLMLVGDRHIGINPMSNATRVELSVGEKGESFSRRNVTMAKVDRQPAGLNFYELRWPTTSMGSVLLKHGALSLPIDNVISITGTEDMDFQEEGLSQIKINSAITKSDMIAHDEARQKISEYLQKILQSGWRPTIPRSVARMRGKDMNDFFLKTRKYTTLDPLYQPSLKEWMQYDTLTTWEFYADHSFLTVQMSREHTLTDPLKPGVYLVSTKVQNEEEHFRGYVDGLDRSRWRQLLSARVDKLKAIRARKELELRSQGVTIDENYVDPPLPLLLAK